jgi:hypothetical protein
VTSLAGQTFKLAGGDGDQAIFDAVEQLYCRASDQTPEIAAACGIVMRVVGGSRDGGKLIFRSRQVQSIEAQLRTSDLASVIVHVVPADFSREDLESNKFAIGMGVLVAERD